jgi:hypothetical protein
MESVDWYPRPKGRKPGNEILSAALKCGVGLLVGALFYLRGHLVLAGVAGGLAVLFFVLSLSHGGRAAIGKVFGFLGEWAGRIVGSVLLSAIFVLVLTPVRALRRLAGIDDLHIEDKHERSYWLPCDPEEHKRRYAGAMFATEARTDQGGRRGVLWLVGLFVILAVAEIVLRAQGYGHPLAYVSDPRAGYLPAPGQSTTWRGAHLATNSHSMRAPERDAKKPAGALRVLALGTDGGLRVDQDQIYARLLERRLLTAKGGAGTVEVWNADVQGWGPPSARGYVEGFGTFDADVAVVTLVPGALEQPLQSVLYTRFAPAERPPRLALEEKLLDGLWQYREGRTVNDAAYASTLRQLGIAECGHLARALRERGAEVLFVVVPPRTDAAAQEGPSFAKVVEDAQARWIELPEKDGAYDREDAALTAQGHAALAEAIASQLLSASPKVRAWLGSRAP